MGARGADREELVAATREQDRIVADVAGEHRSVSERVDRNTQGQIGTGRFGWRSTHVDLPPRRSEEAGERSLDATGSDFAPEGS